MQRGNMGGLGRELHLVVLQHGMWGCPDDMAYAAQLVQSMSDARKVVVLNSDVNTARLTYDGIDVLGDRLAQLVISFCERMAAGGLRHVTRISFIAYSLGGLIARYAIGKLAATGFLVSSQMQGTAHGSASHCSSSHGSSSLHWPAQQWQVRPAWTPGLPSSPVKSVPASPATVISSHSNAVSHSPARSQECQRCSRRSIQTSSHGVLLSPQACSCDRRAQHTLRQSSSYGIGRWGRWKCPPVRPVNFVSFASPHLGSWQPPNNLYRVAFNAVLPYTLSRTGSQLVLADHFLNDQPLLAVMADPAYAFHAGLAMFQKRVLLANTRHDATVPFTTSGITVDNPYEVCAGVPINDRYPCIVRPTTEVPRLLPPSGPSSKSSSVASLPPIGRSKLAIAISKPLNGASKSSQHAAGIPTGLQDNQKAGQTWAMQAAAGGLEQSTAMAVVNSTAQSSCEHMRSHTACHEAATVPCDVSVVMSSSADQRQHQQELLQGASSATTAHETLVHVIVKCSDSDCCCVQVQLVCAVANGSSASTCTTGKCGVDQGMKQVTAIQHVAEALAGVALQDEQMGSPVAAQPSGQQKLVNNQPATVRASMACAEQATSLSSTEQQPAPRTTHLGAHSWQPQRSWFMPASVLQWGAAAMKALLVTQLLGAVPGRADKNMPAAPRSLAAVLCSGISTVSRSAVLVRTASTAHVVSPASTSQESESSTMEPPPAAPTYHTTTTVMAQPVQCSGPLLPAALPGQNSATAQPLQHSNAGLFVPFSQGMASPNAITRSPGKLRSRQGNPSIGSSAASTPFAGQATSLQPRQVHVHGDDGLQTAKASSTDQQPSSLYTSNAALLQQGDAQRTDSVAVVDTPCAIWDGGTRPSNAQQLLAGVPARSLSAPRLLYQSLATSSASSVTQSRPALTAVALSALKPGLVRRSMSQHGGNGVPFGYGAPLYSHGLSRRPSKSSSAAGTLFQELSRSSSTPTYAHSTSISRSSSYSSLAGGFTNGLWTFQRPASGRLQGEVFVALLPLLVLLWCCMLLWLLALSGHHYAVRVMGLRRDRSWPIMWPRGAIGQCDAQASEGVATMDSAVGEAASVSGAVAAPPAILRSPRTPSRMRKQCVGTAVAAGARATTGTCQLNSGVAGSDVPSCFKMGADSRRANGSEPDTAERSAPLLHSASHELPAGAGIPSNMQPAQRQRNSFWPRASLVPVYLLALHWLHSLVCTLLQLLLHAWGHVSIRCWRGLEELWAELLQGWAADSNTSMPDIPMPAGTAAAAGSSTNTASRAPVASRPQRPLPFALSWCSRRVVALLRGVLLSGWELHRGKMAPSACAVSRKGSRSVGSQHTDKSDAHNSTAPSNNRQDINAGCSKASAGMLTLTEATAAIPAATQVLCSTEVLELASCSKQAQLQKGMCEQLNQLAWTKVAVDTQHYHAHACIVVRSAARFAASHGHIVEYAVRQMRDLT